MPKARVIARDPEQARQTVDSLHASGYEVEIIAPGEPQLGPCDLVINLDEHSADPNTYSLDDAESYFIDGEQPPKREFVFAPAWRKVAEFAREQYDTLRQQRLERRGVVAADAPEPKVMTPQAQQQLDYERIAAEFAAQRAQLESAFAAQLQLVKEERRAQGTEILRLQQELAALRQQNEFLSQSRVAAEDTVRPEAPVAAAAPAWRAPDLRPKLNDFMQHGRRICADSSLWAGRATVVAASRMRDLTMRPSFSVAAGIVFAFLLGFWAATGKHQPQARPTISPVEANVSSASVVPPSAPAATTKSGSLTPAPRVRKPSAVKQAAVEREDDGFQEVVVRHYPERGNIARSESPNRVKQYSDIQDEE